MASSTAVGESWSKGTTPTNPWRTTGAAGRGPGPVSDSEGALSRTWYVTTW